MKCNTLYYTLYYTIQAQQSTINDDFFAPPITAQDPYDKPDTSSQNQTCSDSYKYSLGKDFVLRGKRSEIDK